MSSTTPLIAGMVIGGVIITALGAASHYVNERTAPPTKGVVRDFLIGAVMVAMIMQLLPESSTSIVEKFMSLMPTMSTAAAAVSALPLLSSGGGASSTEEEKSAPAAEDMEVKVGPPRF